MTLLKKSDKLIRAIDTSNRNSIGEFLRWIFVFSLISICTSIKAENKVQFNGFISQGFLYTSDNNFYGESTEGSFKLTEIGLNMSKRFSSRLRLSSQVISRVSNRNYDWDLNLDYLFLDYKAPISKSSQLGVRVGRVKNVFGFYNETRDVAFTRPSIFAPPSVYFEAFRDLQLSSDGFIGFGEMRSSYGTTLLEFGNGQARVDSETEAAIVGEDYDGDFYDENVNQARLSFESQNHQWRFALSRVDGDLKYRAGPLTPFLDSRVEMMLDIASIEYSLESTVFTSEFMSLDILAHLEPFPTIYRPFESWYFQVQHYLNTDWTLYSRYEDFVINKNDRKGVNLNATTGIPAHHAYSKGVMIGARWQPRSNWMVMGELQWLDGNAGLNQEDNPNPFTTEKNWQMLSLMLAYRF